MTQPDFSPAAERNRQPILEKLQTSLPNTGHALEIASGTGQHVVWFAQHMPRWTWQPTDLLQGALYNIEARANEAGLDNIQGAIQLDVRREPWFGQMAEPPLFDLIFCANMLHPAPWEVCAALMRGAAQHLTADGVLVTYGPYFEEGVIPAQSNVEFDLSLRERGAGWGIRKREEVEGEAHKAGLQLRARHEMPANNLLLVWARIP